MKKRDIKGVITLEACVTVLSFLILMLLLSGLFVMFMAQNITSHTILQTSQSLSLDAYSTSRTKSESGTIGGIVSDFAMGLFGNADENPSFVTDDKWYDSDDVTSTIKTRFVGYLTGGDEDKADELLEQINVVGGLDGLDFTNSYIADDTLYIVLKYKLEFDFNIWDVNTTDVEQTTCSKLWK